MNCSANSSVHPLMSASSLSHRPQVLPGPPPRHRRSTGSPPGHRGSTSSPGGRRGSSGGSVTGDGGSANIPGSSVTTETMVDCSRTSSNSSSTGSPPGHRGSTGSDDDDVDETTRLRPSVSDIVNSPSPGTQLYLYIIRSVNNSISTSHYCFRYNSQWLQF